MSNEHETVADIVAEMRKRPPEGDETPAGLACSLFADRIEAAHKREHHCKKRYDQNGDEMPPHCAFDDLKIDRLQAKVGELTAELERERVGKSDRLGDAAKLRKALEAVSKAFDDALICTDYQMSAEEHDRLDAIYRQVKSALATPARNCDVGTAEEQSRRCTDFCLRRLDRYPRHPCKTCPARTDDPKTKCEFTWAQLPYEAQQEEGDK